MKKIIMMCIALSFTMACSSKDDKPSQPTDPVVATPTLMPPVPTATPMPVVNHCSPVGAKISCEAQMSHEMEQKKIPGFCKNADNSNWVDMYFKDEAEADAFAKSIGFGLIFPTGNPAAPERYAGKEGVGHFGWHCKAL